jgi:two-component system, NarL family, response regulator DevR
VRHLLAFSSHVPSVSSVVTSPDSTPAAPVRLALVDDSELVRVGLRTLLGLHRQEIEIVAEAANVAEALANVPPARPDVVLLDMRLPDGNGVDVCRRLLAASPGLRVLFLTSQVDDDLIADSIRAGASGYLLKEINGRELVRAIRDVAAGGQAIDTAVTARLMRLVRGDGALAPGTGETLSAQDRRILALLSEGKTNKEIGAALGLAEKTIKNYLTTLFDKLGIERRSQAAAYYVQHYGER